MIAVAAAVLGGLGWGVGKLVSSLGKEPLER